MMLESPFDKEIMEEGERNGRQQGLEQGRQEALRGDVLADLEARFGAVPAAVAGRIQRTVAADELQELLRRAATVEALRMFGAM